MTGLKLRWYFAALLAPAVLSCADAPDGVDESGIPVERIHAVELGAIMNGYPDEDDHAVVGVARLSGGIGLCSGTLIARNVVLTAHHCVADIKGSPEPGTVDCTVSEFGSTYAPGTMFVTTSAKMTTDPDIWTPVEEIRVPPGSGVCGRDIALLVLAEPIPDSKAVPMVPRVDVAIYTPTPSIAASGEGYSAIGYGATSDYGGGSGLRRRRDGLNATCAGMMCGWYDFMSKEWVGDAGVCEGDSGGPAVDGYNRVLGVASRGSAGCGMPVYGYVWAWAAWLRAEVESATEGAGLPVPLWATGWSTHPGAAMTMGQACKSGAACDSMLCADGYCTRYCDDLSPCQDGFYCGEVPPGSALYEGRHCRLLPVGGACSRHEDCGQGICQEYQYCTRTCYEELPCPAGFACTGDARCVLLPVGGACDDDADCGSGRCTKGYCTRLCDEVLSCPAGFVCEGGSCALPPVGEPCSAAAACASGRCAGGYCTRVCSDVWRCPAGYACDAGGECRRIPVGGLCEPGTPACGDGICMEDPGVGTAICTRACHELAPCPDGFLCDEHEAVPGERLCLLAPVGGSCTKDPDCAGGICEGGRCTRVCSSGAPCPSGTVCSASGRCEPEPDSGAGCGAGPGTGPSPAVVVLLLLALVGLATRKRRPV